MSATAKQVLDVAKSWIGLNEADGTHKQILDVYNAHKPLARGYKIKTSDSWCDAFVSACAIKAGAVDIIGTEVSCEKHIAIFKEKGIWIEDGSITPKVGDIILYNWDDKTQPNDGWADRIGIVEKINDKSITVIEGNKNDKVTRRKIMVGSGLIRGYARPKYKDEKPKTVTATKPAYEKDNKLAGTYITTTGLNCRTGAGIDNDILCTIPAGTEVQCYGYYSMDGKDKWLYIQFTLYGTQYTGFSHSKYLKCLKK